MKKSFLGYYPPTDEEYERLWSEATVVLDTNVLLNLYRLPTASRNELLAVLEEIKDRLWIPHQVALEFQRRRLTVIASERKLMEDALKAASQLVDDLRKKVDALQLDKRGIGIKPKPLLDDLEKANLKLIEAINTAHKEQLDISASDPLRERLDALLEERIGPGPTTEQELSDLIRDGDQRYQERIPPGFEDIGKDKNPSDATFIHDKLKYHRKFGDLVLWRQLINYVKSESIKAVLFVTADRKDDWWWREQGKTIGPHPELVREVIREGGVDLFWMYSSVQFMEHANKYATAKVSAMAVDELKQVALVFSPDQDEEKNFQLFNYSSNVHASFENSNNFSNGSSWRSNRRVEEWLSSRYEKVYRNAGYPDFIAESRNGVYGFEVRHLHRFSLQLFRRLAADCLDRCVSEVRQCDLSGFGIIFMVPVKEFVDVVDDPAKFNVIARIFNRMLEGFKEVGIIIGTVADDDFDFISFGSSDFS